MQPFRRPRCCGGSSPHTRGARGGLRRPRLARGIIPAYAGSTAAGFGSSAAPRDHPRIRGEHSQESRRFSSFMGSSPHTRGAPGEIQTHPPLCGIIPAYAGSTCNSAWRSPGTRDHPRIRGEHCVCSVLSSYVLGSSPHTRGALEVLLMPSAMVGIIPAYAGSTDKLDVIETTRRDHPRIRGEHFLYGLTCWFVVGSSPHTRGARAASHDEARGPGIIPAYAGSTPSVASCLIL